MSGKNASSICARLNQFLNLIYTHNPSWSVVYNKVVVRFEGELVASVFDNDNDFGNDFDNTRPYKILRGTFPMGDFQFLKGTKLEDAEYVVLQLPRSWQIQQTWDKILDTGFDNEGLIILDVFPVVIINGKERYLTPDVLSINLPDTVVLSDECTEFCGRPVLSRLEKWLVVDVTEPANAIQVMHKLRQNGYKFRLIELEFDIFD